MDVVVAHLAGAAGNKTGLGAWAAVLVFGEHRRQLSGTADAVTSNSIQIIGLLNTIAALKRPVQLQLRTRSHYLAASYGSLIRWESANFVRIDPGTNAATEIANAVLWRRFLAEMRKRKISIECVNCAEVDGKPGDELASRLAAQKLTMTKAERDIEQRLTSTPEPEPDLFGFEPRMR